MTRIVQSLAQVSGGYEVVYCDLWGCVHDGRRAFPGAIAALRAFRAGGGRVALITNAPRPAASVIAQIERLSVPQDAWDVVVSSGDAAQHAMLSGAVGRRVWHVGADKDEPFFTVPPKDAPAGPAIERVPSTMNCAKPPASSARPRMRNNRRIMRAPGGRPQS